MARLLRYFWMNGSLIWPVMWAASSRRQHAVPLARGDHVAEPFFALVGVEVELEGADEDPGQGWP